MALLCPIPAVKQEASQTSATEQQGSKQVQGNKQQEKLDARRLQEQLQQPHQRGGRAGRDTDRVRDAKRGKPAPENNKKLLDLQRARDEEKKNAEEAAKVGTLAHCARGSACTPGHARVAPCHQLPAACHGLPAAWPQLHALQHHEHSGRANDASGVPLIE